MKQSSLFVNLLLIFCLLTSCASSRHAGEGSATPVPPIIRAEAYSQKYNMQLDFMKHHLSGLLIVRKLPENEIRILASTYFGLSLFDFSLKDGEFLLNSIIEPMRKKKILLLLEADFKNLFAEGQHIRIKEKSSSFEKRVAGKGFGKSVFYLSEFVAEAPEQIRIKHPWLRLNIQLDKLKEKP